MSIFTRTERRAIYVLIGIISIGAIIYFYKIRNPFFAPELDRVILNIEYEQRNIDSLIKDSAIAQRETRPKKQALIGKVNINTASKERLILLPGIGPVYAGRIIVYREEKGRFKTIEEIKNIKGIGEKRFMRLKDKIVVR